MTRDASGNNRYLDAVREAQGLTVAQKHVLLALAARAKRAGVSWPSERRLALDTGMRRRSIGRVLRELEALGVVHRVGEIRSKHGRPVHRRRIDLESLLPFARTMHPDDAEKPDTGSGYSDGGGDAKPDPVSSITRPCVPNNPTEGPIEPPREPPLEPPVENLSTPAGAAVPGGTDVVDYSEFTPDKPVRTNGHKPAVREPEPEGFHEWWAEYPNRVYIDDARKAYAAALTQVAGPWVLIEGLRADMERLTSMRRRPNPSTWLSKRAWLNGPPPAPKSKYRTEMEAVMNLLRQEKGDQ